MIAPYPKAVATALMCCSVVFSLGAKAQATQPLRTASVDELVQALLAPPAEEAGPISRSFVRTALPDASTNLCAGMQVDRKPDTSGGSQQGSRTLEVVPYAGGQTAGVNLDVRFGNSSDALTAQDQTLLSNLAAAMNHPKLREARFAVAGHTSSTGTDSVNLELSCARALATRKFLQSKRIAAGRLTAYGFGSARPLAGLDSKADANRRVEIRLAP